MLFGNDYIKCHLKINLNYFDPETGRKNLFVEFPSK